MNYELGKSLRLDFSRTFYDEFLDNAKVTDVRSMSSYCRSFGYSLSSSLRASFGISLWRAINELHTR